MMESRIWLKSEEKWAYILMLREFEVFKLKVTGSMITLKRNLKAVLDALEQGKAPADAGAKWVETLDVRTIAKAEVDPGNSGLTLHSEGDKPTSISYSTGDSDADTILQTILERSGRTYQPTQEEVGVVEAVLPPLFVGGIVGLFLGGVYSAATEIAAGNDVEVDGLRRRGLKRLLITIAEIIGVNGSIAIGVILLALIVAWIIRRIVHRPERTVWLPAAQA
ncbi:hypothetical protein EP7_005375 [Isosphaeraceae bacterium EP7]